MKHTEIIADDWNKSSDKYYGRIYSEGVIDRIVADPMWAFPVGVRDMLTSAFPDFHSKRVLVPSSGDNGAVFAFHLLGAKVTSADIAERQLHNAQKIADIRGWNIEFIQDDSMRLEQIQDGQYNLVTIAEAEADGYMKFDWTRNPFAALPQWIGFHARKEMGMSGKG